MQAPNNFICFFKTGKDQMSTDDHSYKRKEQIPSGQRERRDSIVVMVGAVFDQRHILRVFHSPVCDLQRVSETHWNIVSEITYKYVSEIRLEKKV